MRTIYNAYINVLLADATYALGEQKQLAVGDLSLGLYSLQTTNTAVWTALKERMTETQANYLDANFNVVTHIENDDVIGSGLDATVWRKKSDGKIFISMQGTEGMQDFLTDIVDITVTGNPAVQLVDMVNWWLRETAATSEQVQQIRWNTVDKRFEWMTKNVWNQAESRYELKKVTVAGTGRISAADLAAGVEVNAHSLGGYLASTFTRLFGSQAQVEHTSTFNSAGFSPSSEGKILQLQNLLTADLGAVGLGRFPNASEQTNYFAVNGLNMTTQNSFWFEQQGKRVELYQEGSATQIPNHFMYKQTDLLALGAVMEKLDSSMTIDKLNNIIKAGSNDMKASYEGVLDALRKMILNPLVFMETPVSDGDNSENRATYHENLQALTDSDEFQVLSLMGGLCITAAAETSFSRNSFSDIAALLTLSPFKITAINKEGQRALDAVWSDNWSTSYKRWSEDKKAIEDGGTASNYTDIWINDRTALLLRLVQANILDIAPSGEDGKHININDENATGNTLFEDKETGKSLSVWGSGQDVHIVRFGGVGDDADDAALQGDRGNDRLYGGDGDDTISGGKDEWVTIIDSDGGLKASLQKACKPHASTKSSLQGLRASTLAKNDSNWRVAA